MTTARFRAIPKLVVLVLAAGLTWPVLAADDDDALRKEALALNDVTGNDPIEAQITKLTKEKEKTKKLLTVAERMARGKEQPFNYNAAFILARSAQEIKEMESAEVMYRLCAEMGLKLRSGQKLAQSYGGLIDLFYENKKFDKTVKICRDFLELRGDETVDRLKPAVMERLIQALTRQGKTEDALKLVDNLVEAEAKENGWWGLQLKGWVLREANKFDDAAKAFETVIERLDKDKTLEDKQKARYIERNRYLLSGVYVDMNKIDKATEHLEALLKNKPDDPTYNNDLGYILADHDMKLDEAEKLIRKAIDEDRKQRKAIPELKPEEDKDNAAYLDSLGWVLFKQKKYDEAKKYLLLAVEDKEGQHIEIYDHLGDVHAALKENDKAVAVWKKGVEAAGESKREQEKKTAVEKKLKDFQK